MMPQESSTQWAIENGLEMRPGEPLKHHVARCMAFLSEKLGRNMEMLSLVQGMAKRVGVDNIVMQAAVDERKAWNEKGKVVDIPF